MLSVAEAFARVLATARPLPTETVPLPHAAGRVLAENLVADRDFPPFNRVAMDGIAVAHAAWAAGQTEFEIEHTQYAGAPPQPLQNPQAAVEVMTGAVLPPGTDVVVRYEDILLDGNRATIQIPPPPAPGVNIHGQAADRRRGDVLLKPGTRLGPAELAVAATVGAAEIAVTRAPRLAVISTGDELVGISETPLPHQIRRSNAYALQALFTQVGADVSLFHLPDDREELSLGLTNILGAGFDAVVLSGAVSKGRADHLPGLLRELGVKEIFHEVNQRPGKPMWFGARAEGPVVFGLPGNPVSTFLTACRYVRPWLRACMQPAEASEKTATDEALAPAVLTIDINFKPQLAHFVPVRLTVDAEGRRLATPLRVGGSGDLAGLLGATAFLELPPEPAVFPAGSVWPAWAL
ncbi:molybdopterin molybdotransferase MoeA [Hymenobacter sp. BT770]|uniref:molybdopterin molybdotransferase MoeA n=1 Tax=Hymenobacter sp. BT770 TaxID=2886942 RepID=UPI001D10DD80|nr:molybdopterin molybdotransferase MoeA [Hymenobacter sp. BT770]MCC3151740.1 molybdopterin molybdotransferase MoeA [Hymenobacter sp. BT770]MDO3413638.1 molybdopterin molybdotransferase MoeA [Hymenobacter sp. BT770]